MTTCFGRITSASEGQEHRRRNHGKAQPPFQYAGQRHRRRTFWRKRCRSHFVGPELAAGTYRQLYDRPFREQLIRLNQPRPPKQQTARLFDRAHFAPAGRKEKSLQPCGSPCRSFSRVLPDPVVVRDDPPTTLLAESSDPDLVWRTARKLVLLSDNQMALWRNNSTDPFSHIWRNIMVNQELQAARFSSNLTASRTARSLTL